MKQEWLFLPLLAQVAVVLMVWVWMYATRIPELIRKDIQYKVLKSPTEAAPYLAAVAGPSDNLKNLFEMPVLFYAAVLVLYLIQGATELTIALCWAYAGLRFVHSVIQCSYNNVMHRFSVYIVSTLVLWWVWGVIGLKVADRLF